MVRTCAIMLVLASVAWSAERRAAASSPAAEDWATLIELARKHESIDLGQAWSYAEQARAAADTADEELAADLRRGAIQRRRGDYDAALLTARAGLERATALRADGLRADFLQLLGHTEWSVANFPAALENYKGCAALAEQTGRWVLAARAHSGIASTYRDLEEFEFARRHYESALAFAEKSESQMVLADILNNFGNYHADIGEHAESLALHRRALALREAAGNTAGMADSFFNLGTAAANSGELEAALAYYQRARLLYETLGFTRNLANLHHNIASVLRRLRRTDKGLEHLAAARELAEKLKSPQLFANIYREFAATMAARGNFESAFQYQQQFIAANDAMLGEKTRRQVAALNVRYETDRRQHEIAMLRSDQEVKAAELQRARTERYGLLGFLALGAIAVAALVSRQRLKLAAAARVHEETRSAKERAERADEFKTRLVSIASHDLKGPVAALIGGAESIQRDAHEPQVVIAMAQVMATEGRRLLAMVRELLDLAALETGRLELERAPIHVAPIVRESVTALESRARAKDQPLTCIVDAEAELATVSGDPARLRQVMDNLLDNAIKFTSNGQPVRVTVSTAADVVRVAVHDTGPGLTPEDYVRVFQPFQKLSAQPTGGESSTGLGLSIARELITLHGGQLIVDSVPGEGATFTFELPLLR